MEKVSKSLNNSLKAANLTKHERELDVEKNERIRGGYSSKGVKKMQE